MVNRDSISNIIKIFDKTLLYIFHYYLYEQYKSPSDREQKGSLLYHLINPLPYTFRNEFKKFNDKIIRKKQSINVLSQNYAEIKDIIVTYNKLKEPLAFTIDESDNEESSQKNAMYIGDINKKLVNLKIYVNEKRCVLLSNYLIWKENVTKINKALADSISKIFNAAFFCTLVYYLFSKYPKKDIDNYYQFVMKYILELRDLEEDFKDYLKKAIELQFSKLNEENKKDIQKELYKIYKDDIENYFLKLDKEKKKNPIKKHMFDKESGLYNKLKVDDYNNPLLFDKFINQNIFKDLLKINKILKMENGREIINTKDLSKEPLITKPDIIKEKELLLRKEENIFPLFIEVPINVFDLQSIYFELEYNSLVASKKNKIKRFLPKEKRIRFTSHEFPVDLPVINNDLKPNYYFFVDSNWNHNIKLIFKKQEMETSNVRYYAIISRVKEKSESKEFVEITFDENKPSDKIYEENEVEEIYSENLKAIIRCGPPRWIKTWSLLINAIGISFLVLYTIILCKLWKINFEHEQIKLYFSVIFFVFGFMIGGRYLTLREGKSLSNWLNGLFIFNIFWITSYLILSIIMVFLV